MPEPVMLADLTTIRVGGPAPRLIRASTAREVAEAVGLRRDVLVLGGGSNLVVADAGVAGPVVQIAIGGMSWQRQQQHSAQTELVTIGAGLNWDDITAELTDQGVAEVAPLSGIPGSVGATPVQNVGAYGAEIADFLHSVSVFDRRTGEVRSMTASQLHLGYRRSILRGTDSAVVLSVTLSVRRGPTTVRYAELAATLGVQPGQTAAPAAVRQAVLQLRSSKGMVLDAFDADTFSAGSFFTNPILDRQQYVAVIAAVTERLGADVIVPAYPAGPGRTKLSAAWLIERAGFSKGYPGPGGRVSISTKHTLALTNRGSGTAADLVALATDIREGVRAAFGVVLQPEPVLVGLALG